MLGHTLTMETDKETVVPTEPDCVVVQVDNTEYTKKIWSHGCDQCLVHYCDQSVLQSCLRVHSTDAEAQAGVFKCSSCGKEQTWSRHILKHMMVLSGERSYLCGVCAKQVSLDEMDAHSHEGTVLICGVCEAQCHTEEELENHCNVHKIKETKVNGRTAKRVERKRSSKSPGRTSMDNDLNNPLRIRMENELKIFYERLRNQVQTKPSTVTSASQLMVDGNQQIQNKRLKTMGLFVCKDCGLQFKEEAVLKIHSLVHGINIDQVGETFTSSGKGSISSYHVAESSNAFNVGQSAESPKQNEQCTILCGVCGQVFTDEEQVKAHCLMHTKELANQSKALNQKLTKEGKVVFDNQDIILANTEKAKNNSYTAETAGAIDLSASGRKHLPSSLEQLKLLKSILENNGLLTSPEKKQFIDIPDETAEAIDLSASGSGHYEKSHLPVNNFSEPDNNDIIQVEIITGCSPEHTVAEVEASVSDASAEAASSDGTVVQCYIVEEEMVPNDTANSVSEQENLVTTEGDVMQVEDTTEAKVDGKNTLEIILTQEESSSQAHTPDNIQNNVDRSLQTVASDENLEIHSQYNDEITPPEVKQEYGPCDVELIKDCIEKHLEQHLNERCEICFKPLESFEHLNKHSLHNCCFCDSCFCNIGSLEKHMYMNHKRRIRYTCEKCGGKYNWLFHLQEHMLIHTAGEGYSH